MHIRRLGGFSFALAGYLALGACAWAPADARATTSRENVVVVDPRAVIHTIRPDFFGVNYVAFWDAAAGSAASARALKQTPIRTVRFPGGAPADWYDWQDPYYQGLSHTSPLQLWRYTRSFSGTHVIFGTNYQGHLPRPSGKAYAVNSPANAAAWVAYNRTRKISASMEVGNEEDLNLLHRADDPAYAAYIARFNAQSRAMHAANSHVQVLGPIGTNEYYWWALDGLGMFLQGTGNKTGTGAVDGIDLHFYRGKSWLDSRDSAQYWLSPTGPWAAIQHMIRAHDTRRLPVYITEWNIGGADQNSSFEPTLGHALVIADMIGALSQSGVAGEAYFDTHGGHSWGLLYGLNEDRPVDTPTPTYYAMALWGHMGNRVVAAHQSDDPATSMSTYATTKADGSVQVLAINKSQSARRLNVSLGGVNPSGRRLRIYTLEGAKDSVDALTARYDGVLMPSPLQILPGATVTTTAHARTLSYTVPGYSAVVLALGGPSRNARRP